MNTPQKIILVILVNALMITMGIYYNNYMVREYKKFVERNKLRVTILSLEEASAVVYGDGSRSVVDGLVTSYREDLNAIKSDIFNES